MAYQNIPPKLWGLSSLGPESVPVSVDRDSVSVLRVSDHDNTVGKLATI